MKYAPILAILLAGCSVTGAINTGEGGGRASSASSGSAGALADAGTDAPDDATSDVADEPDAAPCLPCAALLLPHAQIADIARLCPASVPVWKALHDVCACDTEPFPPMGSGECAGQCTFMPTAAGSWCSDLYQETTCLSCLASSPSGCGGPRANCLNDVGGDL